MKSRSTPCAENHPPDIISLLLVHRQNFTVAVGEEKQGPVLATSDAVLSFNPVVPSLRVRDLPVGDKINHSLDERWGREEEKLFQSFCFFHMGCSVFRAFIFPIKLKASEESLSGVLITTHNHLKPS